REFNATGQFLDALKLSSQRSIYDVLENRIPHTRPENIKYRLRHALDRFPKNILRSFLWDRNRLRNYVVFGRYERIQFSPRLHPTTDLPSAQPSPSKRIFK